MRRICGAILESVRIGWNRQSLDPTRLYPERMQISSRDNAKDELSGAPVSPLFLLIAIHVSLYFPCYASQNAYALTCQKADMMGSWHSLTSPEETESLLQLYITIQLYSMLYTIATTDK